MLSTAPTFSLWWIAGVRFLMAQDPTISTKPRWRDWLRAARQYRLPGPWLVSVTVPSRYIRPGHHPIAEASTQLAMDYLAQSPAARAARERAEAQPQFRTTEAAATAESSAPAAIPESR
jgi:uncharacterized protein